jgi:hypothetical protein
MRRWTKGWFVIGIGLAAVSCAKSAAKKAAEVRDCSRISMDAKGAARCLELQYRWKRTEAVAAATAYQSQQDSIAQSHADSAWRADAARHKKEAEQCAKDPSGEVARCLVGFGWADARAQGTADSLWQQDAPARRNQLVTCTRQRRMQAGACLQLYYKWSPERALAVDDSIARARMKR